MAAEVRITIVTSADGGAVKDVEKNLDSLGKTAKKRVADFLLCARLRSAPCVSWDQPRST